MTAHPMNTGARLAGKHAVITGASRGLGAAIARAYHREGASVLLVARSEPALQEVVENLRRSSSQGQTVFGLTDDLSDPVAPGRIAGAVAGVWNRLDVLVNNAGTIGPIGELSANDWDEWETALRVNLLAPVALCRLLLPMMRRSPDASVINLSGGGATGPRPNFTSYATAKAGLVRFTEVLAHECAGWPLRVNAIAPGIMATDMLAPVVAAGPERVGVEEYKKALAAMNEPPALDKAVDLAVFLATTESAAITGRLLSATWDDWTTLPARSEELCGSDVYALRRIVPADRGKDWR